MQREILFRGKRIDNGEWIYGSLIQRQHTVLIGGYEITAPTWNDSCGDAVWIEDEVIPETIGQFTGLRDKNGAMIFEGDIIETQKHFDRPYSRKKKSKRHKGEVVYAIGKHGENEYHSAEWTVRIEDEGAYGCSNWGPFLDCQVIGSIHDNVNATGATSGTNHMNQLDPKEQQEQEGAQEATLETAPETTGDTAGAPEPEGE